MSSDAMDVDAVLDKLNVALGLQYRSALQYTVAAGSAQGLEWQAFGAQLWAFAAEELDDARRLVEKIVALGGAPVVEVAAFTHEPDAEAAIGQLVRHEEEAVAALHEVIPETGQEPRSEALEHLTEHLIMRKQEQVDTLVRALGGR
jgi:bacterioferritin (cytochrome b1)